MSLKLYGATLPKPPLKGIIRDFRPTWLLEELQVPYERIVMNPVTGETQSPEYLKIHPIGKVPTLLDNDFRLFESAAICEYLCDKYQKFLPPAQTPEYYLAKQWNYFAMSNLDPVAARLFSCDFLSEPSEFNTRLRETFSKIFLRFLPVVSDELKGRDWILASGFSMCDILIVCALNGAKGGQEVAKFPVLNQYLERAATRPAYQRAFQMHGERPATQIAP